MDVSRAQVPTVTGIVLAGGKGLRLSRKKALEEINHQSLIERTVNRLSSISQAILIVTSEDQFSLIASAELKGKLMVDIYPGKAALGGIYTGLTNADTSHCLVVGCDMPLLNEALLHYLISIAFDFDVVVPKLNDMTEPLHAVYSKRCLVPIKQLLDQDRLVISELFSLVRTRYVGEDEIEKFDPQHLSFLNVNTFDELMEAKSLVEQREQCSMDNKDRSS